MEGIFKFWVTIIILAVVGTTVNACHSMFGREISEVDFPRYVQVVGVVQQPEFRFKTAVIRVHNVAPRWVAADRIEFVCRYRAERTSKYMWQDHEPGQGVEEGWMQMRYRGEAIGAGETKDIEVPVDVYRMRTPYYEITNCVAAKTIEQGIDLTNAPIDLRGGMSVSPDPTAIDRRAIFRPQYPVLGR